MDKLDKFFVGRTAAATDARISATAVKIRFLKQVTTVEHTLQSGCGFQKGLAFLEVLTVGRAKYGQFGHAHGLFDIAGKIAF